MMSDAIWSSHPLSREHFSAAALAVACLEKRQELPIQTQPPIDAEDLSDDDSVHSRDLVASGGEQALQKKFLNRLAEIFARQKTPSWTKSEGSSSDANHVSAAILGFKDRTPRVFVAKNSGLDAQDKTFLTKLETWLRAVSTAGQHRSIDADSFWATLIDYNNMRLRFYVSEFAKMNQIGNNPSYQDLQEKCKRYVAYPTDSGVCLNLIIHDAYALRYKPLPKVRPKAATFIHLLSRMRAAWETLQQFALRYASCKDIEIRGITSSGLVKIPISIVKSELETLQKDLSKKVTMGTTKHPWQNLELYTHAEMQLLLFYGSYERTESSIEYVPYMGSSKKTCWLCEQILRTHGVFSSRGTHGEVSAHWTLETNTRLERTFLESLRKGMCDVQSQLITRIRSRPGSLRPAMPQSSASVTSTGSAASIAKIAFRREDYKRSVCGSNVDDTQRNKVPKFLGRCIGQITAVRIPVDGRALQIVTVDICEHVGGEDCFCVTSTIPDFSPFWGVLLHNEQDQRRLGVEKNVNVLNDGTYVLFFNTSEELPLNEGIAGMLELDQYADTIEHRLVWKGDVFIVRYHESKPGVDVFLSLTPGSDLQEVIRIHMRHAWNDQFLEKARQRRRDLIDFKEREDRNRELVKARLSPSQLNELSRRPLGLVANLDFLTMHQADHGAIVDTWMEPCPDDPSMIAIHTIKKVDELDRKGWNGFSSDQL